MRARTRRFRSFSRGIVGSPLNAPRVTPQQRRDDAKDRRIESGSVPPFASLEDSGWGGVVRGWALTVAKAHDDIPPEWRQCLDPTPSSGLHFRPLRTARAHMTLD